MTTNKNNSDHFNDSTQKDSEVTETYFESLVEMYRPIGMGLSRMQRFMLVLFFIIPVFAWFFEGIFCYSVVIIMIVFAFTEYKSKKREKRNLSLESENELKSKSYFTYALYTALPVVVFNLIIFMAIFSRSDINVLEQFGALLSAGYIGTLFAINVGHELVHRRDKFESNFGGLLLSLVCYATFKVEHVRGHHVYVSTPEDASSAPLGMTIYRFLPRALIMNPVNGFKLEAKRLKSEGKPAFHWQNELIWWTALSLSFSLISYMAFGVSGLIFFFAQSVISISMLEIINYIEHYGLERKKLENGRYERVTHHHSWNASEVMTNNVLFNLERHSDHHANPTRPFQILRHFDESPQLPTGYFGMLYLALWPKKWFEVMNPKAQAYMDYIREQREANEGKLQRI